MRQKEAGMYDIVIRNGMVVDGTRMPRRQTDIGIRDGVVTKIGRIDASAASEVIDASGLIVAPGFIDLHTHYDAQLFWDPYCTISGWHGVTSVLIGNCGFGFAPTRPDDRERAMRSMTRVEAIPFESMSEGLPWTWETFPEFLDALEATPKSVNIRPFVPLGPLLVWVLGWERAKAGMMPTDAEHAEMKRLLHEAMDAGAGGWSAQRLHPDVGASVQRDFDGTPMVTDLMRTETAFTLCEVLAERSDGFIQITNGSPNGEDSHWFVEQLALRSTRPVLMNAVQAFEAMPEAHRAQLAWLEDCRRRGLPVYGQGVTTDAGFTLTFEDWNLFDESDAWAEATTGTVEERLAKLADPARRQALREANLYVTLAPVARMVVLSPKSDATKKWANHTVGDVATALGVHPIDAMLDIAVADGLATVFWSQPAFNTTEEGMQELLHDPYLLPGVSDGGAHTKFLTAGRYPTELISRGVRDSNLLSLEEAHWKLSALPARCAGFANRGTLEVGMAADIVVYDLDQLAMTDSEVAHDFPGNEWRRIQRGVGYRWVLVNGAVTIEDDKQTDRRSGQLLRQTALAAAT
jgi:N-acyl-D-aspartate/D-glutamate deacylase